MTKELIEEAREWLARGPVAGSGTEIMRGLADALEAATRVPVKGEPNDELIEHALDYIENGTMRPERRKALQELAARAAVPDAATERERADLWRSLDWMLWGVGMNDVFREPLADKMIAALSDGEFDQAQDLIRGWDARRGGPHARNLFVEIKAERDAALAAVGRIRQAVSGHPECDRYEEGDVISCGWKSAYASVVAALDEAPEPEVKP